MKRFSCVILISLICSFGAFAQSTQIQNDCIVQFGVSGGFPLTSAGASTNPFQNNRLPCYDWRMSYYVDGFSAVSLVIQTASDSNGSPGAWSTFPGTPSDGINPNTAITWAATRVLGAPPWIRVLLNTTTGSGSVYGVLYGCKQPGCSSAGNASGSAPSTPCGATSGAPCITAAVNSSGSTITDFTCDFSAAIAVSAASGLQQIIPATAGKSIRLCHLSYSSSGQSTMQIESGTGSNCGSGTTAVSGSYQGVLTFVLDFAARETPAIAAGSALCLNFGTTITAGGLVTYALF